MRGTTDEPIYNRLAVLRAERGLSRRQLADAVRVHYQTIGYLERGEYSPSLALAFRIARFFGLPLEAVFSDRPFPPLGGAEHGHDARRAVADVTNDATEGEGSTDGTDVHTT